MLNFGTKFAKKEYFLWMQHIQISLDVYIYIYIWTRNQCLYVIQIVMNRFSTLPSGKCSTTRKRIDIKMQLCLSAPMQKNNIESNHHDHIQTCDFSVLDWKYPFTTNSIQKIKILFLSWNLVPTLIRICKCQ